jgi:hypothetical protein
MNLICIPALKCHKDNLEINIDNLLNFVNKNDILIITPNVDDFKDFREKGFNVQADSFFSDISKSEIISLLNSEKKFLNSWYYQQFLKYSIVLKCKEYSNVIIIDADSIILNDRVLKNNFIFLNNTEYHRPYFSTIKNLFPSIKCLNKSAINNFQNFNREVLSQMIHKIEKIKDEKWYLYLIDQINHSHDIRAFSEYETYANYSFYFHNHELKSLKIFRRGDLINLYLSKDSILKLFKNTSFDIIGFEISHNIKMLHRFYSIFWVIILILKKYEKNIFSKFQSNK